MKKNNILKIIKTLWPICRSITGDGLKKSIFILKSVLPPKFQKNFKIININSGQKIFDWVIPDEWIINDAYIKKNNKKIVDFNKNNLHVVNYSHPIDKKNISLLELKKYLYFDKKSPNAIPYITSYYNKKIGMCISYNYFKKLETGKYNICINSKFKKGHSYIGNYYIKGKSKDEVFFSTYLCHPSLANDNLTGPAISIKIAEWISKKFNGKTKYSYRFVYGPETIGSIYYINKNLNNLKKRVKYAFNLTCLAGAKNFSFLPSRTGNTETDKLVENILKYEYKKFEKFSFLDRGSDERQYCNPNVDLPMVSVMKKKYHEYKQYHNSLDNLSFIKEQHLLSSFEFYKNLIFSIENNFKIKNNFYCEPPLKKYFPTLSKKKVENLSKLIFDILIHSDGKKSLLEIADKLNVSILSLIPLVKDLKLKKIISLK